MGELVDDVLRAGLKAVRAAEESFELDFDEWFDRGTPDASKEEVRSLVLSGPGARGFQPCAGRQGVRISCRRSLARGVKED
jgi:hypothetical protein